MTKLTVIALVSFFIANPRDGIIITSTMAFPTGAGGCPGGQAAVGAAHLRDGAVNGTLADGGVTFTIGDTIMVPGDTFETNPFEEFNVTTTATATNPIKGILVRLQCQTDLTGALTSDDPLIQDATACAQDDNFVVGMTHTSNVEKTDIVMNIVLDTTTTVSVDVTVVMQNNDEQGSMYYYDRFYYKASHPPCDICGGFGPIGDPEAIIQIPEGALSGVELTEIDCATAYQLGMDGQISPELCPLTPALAGPVCLCGGNGGGNMTTFPTTTTATAPSSTANEDMPSPPPSTEVGDGSETPSDPPASVAFKVMATVVMAIPLFATAATVFPFLV